LQKGAFFNKKKQTKKRHFWDISANILNIFI
jgi:hypothetical protein